MATSSSSSIKSYGDWRWQGCGESEKVQREKESKVKEREKNSKILNVKATITMHI